MFFGREDVFSFIRRNLIGEHRDMPVVLYGQRRTGKTSVLYQLHRHLDPRYRCIFVDLHGLNLSGMGNLLLGIANAISRGLRRDHQLTVDVPDRAVFLADPRPAFETTFLDAVWPALGEGHLVLMLDEVIRIDEEVKSGRLERDIFDYLRHLMQHHTRLNFIFSLGSGLERMKKDYAFLFSVALYCRISFLEPTAARELITLPVRDLYQVAPPAVEKILQITSGHPYYTQLVCHCLFDLWSRSPKPVMDAADVEAVLAEAIELGSANLTYVWEDSTPGEQALMAGMAAAMQGRTCPVTLHDVQDTWREAGAPLPDRELASALRSLTAREIVTGSQAYSFTVDLQRLWLQTHRRLDWVKEDLAETVQQWNRSAAPRPTPVMTGPPSWATSGQAGAPGPAKGATRGHLRPGGSRRASRPRPPAGQPDDAVTRAIKAAVKPGLLTFNPPAEMIQGRRERVEVGIARSPELREALAYGLRGRGEPQFERVSTSPFMGVELRGAAFEVTSFSPAEQLVAPIARWEFDVTPNRAGYRKLTLCVSLRVDYPAAIGGRIAVPVLERDIRIRVDIGFSAHRFLVNNWQWLIVVFLGLGSALTTWIALFH
jgi:hypothetical protein